MFYISHNNFIYNNNCAKVIFTDKLSVNIAFNTSFSSLLCLDGEVTFDGVTLKKGDCAFIPANRGEITFEGSATVIESRV